MDETTTARPRAARRPLSAMTRARGASDERGSLPMALLLTMVAAALVATLTATVISGVRSADFDQLHTGSIHVAEAGLEEAREVLLQELIEQVDGGDGGPLDPIGDVPGVFDPKVIEEAVEHIREEFGDEDNPQTGTLGEGRYEWWVTDSDTDDDTPWFDVEATGFKGERGERTITARLVPDEVVLFEAGYASRFSAEFIGGGEFSLCSLNSEEGLWNTGEGLGGLNLPNDPDPDEHGIQVRGGSTMDGIVLFNAVHEDFGLEQDPYDPDRHMLEQIDDREPYVEFAGGDFFTGPTPCVREGTLSEEDFDNMTFEATPQPLSLTTSFIDWFVETCDERDACTRTEQILNRDYDPQGPTPDPNPACDWEPGEPPGGDESECLVFENLDPEEGEVYVTSELRIDAHGFEGSDLYIELESAGDEPVRIFVTDLIAAAGEGVHINCGDENDGVCDYAHVQQLNYEPDVAEDTPEAPMLQVFTADADLDLGGDFSGHRAANAARIAWGFYGPNAACSLPASLTVYGAMICAESDDLGDVQLWYDEVLSGATVRPDFSETFLRVDGWREH